MKSLLWVTLFSAGCAQLQAQRGPSWLSAESGWTADRVVCLGHSGADGGVRDADWAAARCTAGYAQAWLTPAIEAHVKEDDRRKRTFIALARLAKVVERYENPASGEVTSRMELTQEEVDRQIQREFMDEQELLAGLRLKIGEGLSAKKQTAATDPVWLKARWAKIEPIADLPEKVRAELAAQEAAAKEASAKAQDQAEPGTSPSVKAVGDSQATAPKAGEPLAEPATKNKAKPSTAATKTPPKAKAKAAAPKVKPKTKPKTKLKKPAAKNPADKKAPKAKPKPGGAAKKPTPKAAPKALEKEPS
jgi:hypothetical protein